MKFFDFDGPVFQFLEKVCDIVIINLLFILCSLPIVTLGASAGAMNYATQCMVYDKGGGTAKCFFKGFKANFKQSTLYFIPALLIMASLVYEYIFLVPKAGATGQFSGMLIFFLMILLVCFSSYIFPLIVRYKNSLKDHIKNGVLLTFGKLPRTVLLFIYNTLPIILFILDPVVFMRSSVFWAVIGFGLMNWLCSRTLKPVFDEIENEEG